MVATGVVLDNWPTQPDAQHEVWRDGDKRHYVHH